MFMNFIHLLLISSKISGDVLLFQFHSRLKLEIIFFVNTHNKCFKALRKILTDLVSEESQSAWSETVDPRQATGKLDHIQDKGIHCCNIQCWAWAHSVSLKGYNGFYRQTVLMVYHLHNMK